MKGHGIVRSHELGEERFFRRLPVLSNSIAVSYRIAAAELG